MAGSGRRLFTKKESEAAGFLARSLGGKACDAILFPISLFAAALVRFLYCGFTYFPQLDDYIQYHNYAASENIPELLGRLGAFSVRPLALVTDIRVWSRFWGRMIVPLIIMAALWTASALFLREVLRRFYPVGNYFPLVFVLLPLNIEATYWLSASSRIVVGTFFASLSAYFLTLFCERGKKRFAALFLLFNILSFCFYEQCLIFSLVLTVLVAVRFLGKPCKRAFLGAGVLLSGGVYIAVTHLFATEGVYSSRASVVLPFGSYYYRTFLPALLSQIGSVFVGGGVKTAVKGAWRGIGQIVSDRAFAYALAAAAVSALIGLCFRFSKVQRTAVSGKGTLIALPKGFARLRGFIAGLILAAAPLSVYFVVENPWFSLRSAACSMCGLALIADLLIGLILTLFRRAGVRRILSASAAAVLSLLFVCAGVSEVCDYRETYLYDQSVVSAVCETAEKEGWEEDQTDRFGLLGVRDTVLDDQNFYWHEHVHGVTESDWALSGAVTERMGVHDWTVFPLTSSDGVIWQGWNREARLPDGFDRMYLYHGGELERVSAGRTEDGWEILGADGETAAVITDGEIGTITFFGTYSENNKEK